MPSNFVMIALFVLGMIVGSTIGVFVAGRLGAIERDRLTADYHAAWFIAEAARACLIIPAANWPGQKVFCELRTTLVKLTPVEEHNRRVRNRKRGKASAWL